MAVVALVWLTSTLLLLAFGVSAVVAVLRGEDVQLQGPFLAASLPVAMWVARELLSAVLLAVGWVLSILGHDPADAVY